MEMPPVGRDELAQILVDAGQLFSDVLSGHPEWFRSDLRDQLASAFEELRPSFEMAIRYLNSPPDPLLLDAQLAHIGFREENRALKIGGFRGIYELFTSTPTKRLLGRLLGWL